jgi:hypothetical protein
VFKYQIHTVFPEYLKVCAFQRLLPSSNKLTIEEKKIKIPKERQNFKKLQARFD